jgi:Zn finger protein HypA/HybF involved in hydrogenase expression
MGIPARLMALLHDKIRGCGIFTKLEEQGMGVKTCVVCKASLDGWVYEAKVLRDGKLHVENRIAQICRSCGAAVCQNKHNKEIKGSSWLSLDKAVCPHCGGPFGPADFMSDREVSRAAVKELPSGLMTPWALNFLDSANGEKLLAADKPSKEFAFSLIVTDRRLIVLEPLDILAGLGNSPREWTVPDRQFITWPLKNLASIETKLIENHTTKMTIKTDTGESHTWQTTPPFDHMVRYIKAAMPNAIRPLTFPEGEGVFFDGGANLELLNLNGENSPFTDTELLARQFFNKTARLSLAVTNRRMLFYRINHIHEMNWQGSGLNLKLGPPQLQSISLPWEAVRRFVVSGGFVGGNVSMILEQPLWAWTTQSLRVLPHELLACKYETRACIRCGGSMYGGVGPKRIDQNGKEIESTVVGSYCSKCNTALHKSCLKTLENLTSKCPTCGQPRQVIDRGYYTLIMRDEVINQRLNLARQFSIPPVGKPGEEWKLTLTKNIKAWEAYILPAVRRANPQVRIEGK